MQRRQFTTGLPALIAARGAACALLAASFDAWALGETEAAAGVREARQRGAEIAVAMLGRPDGVLGNPQGRIGLPGALESAAAMLRAIGQQRRVDELVTAMNRAAEAAVPEAKPLLASADPSTVISRETP